MNFSSAMSVAIGFADRDVVQYSRSFPGGRLRRDTVVIERPLKIEVNESSYTLLRTPGADRELCVGFLFTEGLIEKLGDILILRQCPDSADSLTVKVSDTREKPSRSMLITSSCGLCGREDIEAMVDALGRVESSLQVSPEMMYRLPETVRARQELFDLTGGAHASAFFDEDGNILGVKEDVGRHNALDKLIGQAIMQELPMNSSGVFLSGRTSLEMIVKAARARIPVVAAVGAPTEIAAEAAERLGITLCGFLRDQRLSVYTHGWRIRENV